MFLVLLCVALIALVSGLVVKGLIMKELDQHLAVERPVMSDIGTIVLVGSFLTAGLVLASVLLLIRTTNDRRTPVKARAGRRENTPELSSVLLKEELSSTEAASRSRPDESGVGVSGVSVAVATEETPEVMPDEPMDPDDVDMQQNPGDAEQDHEDRQRPG